MQQAQARLERVWRVVTIILASDKLVQDDGHSIGMLSDGRRAKNERDVSRHLSRRSRPIRLYHIARAVHHVSHILVSSTPGQSHCSTLLCVCHEKLTELWPLIEKYRHAATRYEFQILSESLYCDRRVHGHTAGGISAQFTNRPRSRCSFACVAIASRRRTIAHIIQQPSLRHLIRPDRRPHLSCPRSAPLYALASRYRRMIVKSL